jgi:hypothetical protein
MIEAILNRLRGTGLIKYFGTLTIFKQKIEIKLVWNHIYGLWIALVLGVATLNAYIGLAIFIAYLVGESKGWGEWVGALTRWEPKDENWLLKQYRDNEGKKFPFIHQISNSIIPEKMDGTLEDRLEQYNMYATLALALRGMYWWGLVYGVLLAFGEISLSIFLVATILLGVGFPIACFIGRQITYTKKYGFLHFSRGWENQEIIYGLFQGAVLWFVVMLG